MNYRWTLIGELRYKKSESRPQGFQYDHRVQNKKITGTSVFVKEINMNALKLSNEGGCVPKGEGEAQHIFFKHFCTYKGGVILGPPSDDSWN